MEQQQSGQSSDTKTSTITAPSSSSGQDTKNARETPDRPVTNSSPPAATTPLVGDASSPSSTSVLGSKSDDNLSIKSSDSVTTSGEYEIVPEAPLETLLDAATEGVGRSSGEPEQDTASNIADLAECIAEWKIGGTVPSSSSSKVLKAAISPILNIEGDGNMMDLEKNMNEVIHELDEERTLSGATDPSSSDKACFAKAFQRALPPSVPVSMSTSLADSGLNVMLASVTSDTAGNPIQSAMYEFAVSLEIKEKERNGYVTVPRDVKSSFRLRCKTDKEVCITVRQVPSEQYPPLLVERCFGVLLSPGKIVRQADMQLLDMVSMGYVKPAEGAGNAASATPMASTTGTTTGSTNSNSSSAIVATNFSQFPYQIKAEWKANAFEPLNMETPKKALTVAVDLVIKGIQEPVRFVIETSVSILAGNELRIVQNLFNNKRPLLLHFYLTLRENGEGTWEVDSIDHSDEIVDPPGVGSGGAASSLSLNFNFRNWGFKNSASKTVSTCSKCSSSIPRSSPLHASYGRNLQQANSVNNNVHNQTNNPSEDQLDGGSSDQNNSNASTTIGDLGPLDPLVIATQRIRELELELAQTKLAQVEAECKNQDLLHQLNTAATELQATRSSWQPWLSKTLTSIQEKVATKRDQPGPTFQSYAASDAMTKNYPASQTNSNLPPPQQLRSNTKAPLTQRHSLTSTATGLTAGNRTVEDDEVTRRAKYDSSVNVLYKDTRCNSLK
ncbi:hypothetical protein AND_003508 [Anopheles darlingi]|uniref:Kinesin-like domain-containing protein n=1 Tax=Anopheles darlingi TaxID=43151 RepID=W5JPQ4_ANODA|nr:hypothetical protein AND_003508 [Anopheles darlingi]